MPAKHLSNIVSAISRLLCRHRKCKRPRQRYSVGGRSFRPLKRSSKNRNAFYYDRRGNDRSVEKNKDGAVEKPGKNCTRDGSSNHHDDIGGRKPFKKPPPPPGVKAEVSKTAGFIAKAVLARFHQDYCSKRMANYEPEILVKPKMLFLPGLVDLMDAMMIKYIAEAGVGRVGGHSNVVPPSP